jgi:hypothetical protein
MQPMALEEDECEICRRDAKWRSHANDMAFWNCPHCGCYVIAKTDLPNLRRLPPTDRPKVYGWIREKNRTEGAPHITSSLLSEITARPLPSIRKRAEFLLLEAIHKQANLCPEIRLEETRFKAATYSENPDDVNRLLY